jgi:hypothetical protein
MAWCCATSTFSSGCSGEPPSSAGAFLIEDVSLPTRSCRRIGPRGHREPEPGRLEIEAVQYRTHQDLPALLSLRHDRIKSLKQARLAWRQSRSGESSDVLEHVLQHGAENLVLYPKCRWISPWLTPAHAAMSRTLTAAYLCTANRPRAAATIAALTAVRQCGPCLVGPALLARLVLLCLPMMSRRIEEGRDEGAS